MRNGVRGCGARIVFGLLVFAILATAILMRPPKWLSHFDQSLYLTVAYDLNHHGVFSNGVFDRVDSTVATPPPGMFLAPVYPWLVVAATKLDGRFAQAVDCSVEADHRAAGPASRCRSVLVRDDRKRDVRRSTAWPRWRSCCF